jgi:hypothetical protein
MRTELRESRLPVLGGGVEMVLASARVFNVMGARVSAGRNGEIELSCRSFPDPRLSPDPGAGCNNWGLTSSLNGV